MLQPGTIVFLKTTEEPAVVLQVDPGNGEISVRRPVQGRDGIFHYVNTFMPFELETFEEKAKRMTHERKHIKRFLDEAEELDLLDVTPATAVIKN